ncbi:MAG: HU family DNA-binding protein [Prevotella sp.]|nr:HU family DNA-binding protein [Prevotella sp.]
MNNKEYIAELSRHTGFSQDDTQRMVRCVVECMSQKFDEGVGISIANFGIFEIKKRMERIVVNPSNGQRMLVPPKIVVAFKAETSVRKSVKVPKGSVDISDFGKVLAERYGLNDNDAFSFVHFMFATVSEELLVHPDATVKIKGLGSFKAGRGKYVFSPEVMLRDRINRPFLQFETVVLNDGVDFSEMDEDNFVNSEDNEEEVPLAETETEIEVPETEVRETAEEESPINTEETSVNTEKESVDIKEEPAAVLVDNENIEEQPAGGQTTADIHCGCDKAEAQTCVQTSEEQSERERCRKMAELLMAKNDIHKEEEPKVVCRQKNPKLTYWLSALSFLLLLCIGAGLYALYVRIEARNQAIEKLEKQIEERKQALSKQVVAKNRVQPVEKVGNRESIVSKDFVAEAKPVAEVKSVVESKPRVQTSITDYNYDARVRTGAYVIVGIDQVVTVQKGQTLASISKAFLGDGMECYVEVLNKCTEVKPGEKLKIPKLKLKKRIGKNH